MKNTNLTFKFKRLNLFILPFFLMMPFAGANAACCTSHGGVASCNKVTGYKMCKDGTASPTCTCAKTKAAAIKAKSKATTQTKSTWFGTKTSIMSDSYSAKGCCSRHGGVAKCNKLKKLLTCKDGSLSSSCSCR
ncbi:MAG: hypothetical protein H0U57_11630 [Tatlockia sp.]|nr:hypothetical protein [Tatlockia sp.]